MIWPHTYLIDLFWKFTRPLWIRWARRTPAKVGWKFRLLRLASEQYHSRRLLRNPKPTYCYTPIACKLQQI